MQESQSYVIVGSGIAGITAAETLREEDSSASITIITDDPFPVYYRPALKDYLAGRIQEPKLWARGIKASPESAQGATSGLVQGTGSAQGTTPTTRFYEQLRIQMLKGRVVNIFTGQHVVELQNGQRIDYSHLLLAAGAQACTLSCPGVHLAGVTTLRTIGDYRRIVSQLTTTRHVVVSGSGILALETVETLRQRGHQVTHLIRHQQLWSEVLDQTASDLVLQAMKRDGVDVRLADEIAEIRGNQRVKEVYTKQGVRIACEMVIIAIGIEPNVGLAEHSNIACGRGVKVDVAMKTSDPAVYAAGDIVETTDKYSGRVRLLGQWYPAIQQARAAAYSMLNLLDMQHPFDASTFYNATLLYKHDFACAGLTNMKVLHSQEGYQEIVADPVPRVYRKVILKDGVCVGMLAFGDRTGTMELKRAMDHHVNLLPVAERLFTRDFVLRNWLDDQGVPPARPGVKRAGEAVMQQTAFAATGTYYPVLVTGLKSRTEGWLEVFDAETRRVAGLAQVQLSQIKVITIGRREGLYLCIDHASVSRNHAEIRYMQGQYILRDLGSKNGTSVNGRMLVSGSTYILKPQDYIQFGKQVTFIFQERRLEEEQA